MVSARAARDWYGSDWRKLRGQLIKLCVYHADSFFDQLSKDSAVIEHASERYLAEMLRRIDELAIHDELGLWRNAPPLLSNASRFAQWVTRDLQSLRGTKVHAGKALPRKSALGRLLWQFFELARRELVAFDKNVSVNRVKTWERLKRISRTVSPEPEFPSAHCCEEHFLAISDYVKAKHRQDKNLPRKTSTIREYFFEFSDTCIEIGVSESAGVVEVYDEDEQGYLSDAQETQLLGALNALTDFERACLDVEFGTRLGTVTFTSTKAFMAHHGLDDDDYRLLLDKTLVKALPLLQEIGLGGIEVKGDE